jgi:predicted signal transduction protein with EAL and GGDEF domain
MAHTAGTDSEVLLAAADAALYAAKSRRVGSFVFSGDPDVEGLKSVAEKAQSAGDMAKAEALRPEPSGRRRGPSVHVG